MLDERGGIRCDLTIARLGRDRFQIGANGNLDLDWLARTRPTDGSVHVRDITAGTCCIGLWGPRARDVLAPLTDADVSNEAFRYFQARELAIGHVPVTALRLSYVGELGWELYTTADLGREALGHALGGGRGARHHRRWTERLRQPAAREGLPLVGRRHDARAPPRRGGPRVRGPDGEGRLRGP